MSINASPFVSSFTIPHTLRLKQNQRQEHLHPHLKPQTNDKQICIPSSYKEWNQIIGNPINRNTDTPQEVTPYQIEYHEAIQNYHKVLVNKSRKIGATEAVIRSIALNCFDRYVGHDVMIIAGNELNIAREILIRFDELFRNKQQLGYAFQDLYENKWQYNELIRRSSIYSQQPIIEFKNDTRVFCFAASKQGKSQSFRGPDDIVCIFLSEAAHTGMLEDQPIMNALEPNLANRDDGDLIVESTPNGKRGFFYNYWIDAQEGKNSAWRTLQWDYNTGLKYGVLSAKYIEEQKNNQRIDFEQEYCCQFTSTVTAAFHKEDLCYLPKNEKPIDLLTLIGKKSI